MSKVKRQSVTAKTQKRPSIWPDVPLHPSLKRRLTGQLLVSDDLDGCLSKKTLAMSRCTAGRRSERGGHDVAMLQYLLTPVATLG